MALSRRSLLASAAGCLAGMNTWRLPAAEKVEEFSFEIVSDSHLGRNDNLEAERQWKEAVGELNRAKGAFVLHLGDVVDGGREAQYPIYAATRKELKKPIYEIPGNHDPHELFEKHVRTPIDSSFDHGGVRFLLLGNAHRDSHDGFITPEQIAWLDKQCGEAAAKDFRVILCCHVPIHANAHPDRGWYVKPADGQTAFYEMEKKHADVLLACLHGHFHNGIRGWRDRGSLAEAICPSVCYNQDRKLAEQIKAGAAKGFYVDELRPGYLLATLGKGRLTLRYKPLSAEVHGEYAAEWQR
jgi:predicted phosphodiesterase